MAERPNDPNRIDNPLIIKYEPYSKFTNSLGCLGLKVCLLSGSEACRWTMISCGALDDLFLFLRADIASTRVLLPLLCVWRCSQVACQLLIFFKKRICSTWKKQRHILLCGLSADQRYLGLWEWWTTLQHVFFSLKMKIACYFCILYLFFLWIFFILH